MMMGIYTIISGAQYGINCPLIAVVFHELGKSTKFGISCDFWARFASHGCSIYLFGCIIMTDFLGK